ncbi:MAG: carboxypeptidase-like regulatory domain-containing protein [Candidatus Acidiferrales bacterium]
MRREVISKLLILISVLSLCVFLLVSAGTVKAQSLYGSIRGTVTDSTGATVPGVAVTATNMATNISQQVTSKDDGSYNFLQLAIGDYSIKAEKTGFQVFTATRIHLDVNTVFTQDIPLTLGAMSQEVTVQANAVQVETTTPQLGIVVDANDIVNLPLIGRNFVSLQAVLPGVVAAADRFGTSNYDFATNGAQTQMNVYLIDGTDSGDIAVNTPSFIPSADAIDEFRLVTSTLNPEYNRSSGAILNAVLKSGSNSFHGDAFDFYRDTFLDAVPYFAPQSAHVPPPYQQNEFGGTIGGPVIKNHTFFFFSYQGIRATTPQTNPLGPTIETTVYTPAQLAGDFGAGSFAGSTNPSPIPLWGDPCPPSGAKCAAGTPYSTLFASGNVPTQDFNATALGLVKKYVPLPNVGTDEFSFNATQPEKDNQYIVKINQTFTSKDTLWGTWFIESFPVSDSVPFAGATLPGFGMTEQQHWKLLTVSWTHIINDHMLNELRVGYDRFNFASVEPATSTQPSSAGFSSIAPQLTSGAGLPVMQVTGLFTIGFSADGPQPRIDQVRDATDNFSWTKGSHTMKFGFDYRQWNVWSPFSFDNDGNFNYSGNGPYSTKNTGVDFLLGIPDIYTQGSGGTQYDYAKGSYAYAQDSFKIRPNLTLTYGLGWSIDSPMINAAFHDHAQTAFRPGQQSVIFPNAPVGYVFQGDPGVNAPGTVHLNDLGPRIGFAWSPDLGRLSGGPGKLSIRAGYGIYYNRSEQEQDLQVLGMPPYAVTTVLGGPGSINPSFPNPFADIKTGATAPNLFPFTGAPSNVQFTAAAGFLPLFSSCCAVLSPNTQDPMAENYNLTIERQLSNSMILSVGYVGSRAYRLTYGLPQNIANSAGVFPYNVATYGSIDTLYSGAKSNYNALQVSLNKRLYHGLEFLASYTYSHSIDDGSGFENSTFGEAGGGNQGFGGGGAIRASNPYCFPACDYASSTYDARQRLVVSYFYEIPGMHGDWIVSRLTKGWTIAGITTFQTGFPLDVADESFPSGGLLLCCSDFVGWDGPNQVAPVTYLNPRSAGNPWFSPGAFAQVTPNGNPTSPVSYGDAPRNPIRGPGLNNWDFQLYKDTQINERTRFELRIEAYNVFNHTQFDSQGVITDIIAPNFGDETLAHSPRLIQLAAKFYF